MAKESASSSKESKRFTSAPELDRRVTMRTQRDGKVTRTAPNQEPIASGTPSDLERQYEEPERWDGLS
ncbi:MAG: hypothetical protein ACREIT_02540 [Tepidisphaeraceae bacterium]